jgi:hypothetical protein
MIGINCYLMPELAARGLLMMSKFYDEAGNPLANKDIEHEYPDLGQFPVYTSKGNGRFGL